jgi:outer membrane lipoprotein carrier protein
MFFVVLILSAGFSPARADMAREQLERFTEGLDTLHAAFTQTVVSPDNQVQDSSEGEVWLRRPDRFRWAYGGDFPELVVADGARVWIHDVMLEQVTVREQSEAAMNSPLSLLTDPSRLDESFEVRESGAAGEVDLLELRAHDQESQFERFLLGLQDDRLVLMIMEDAFGLRTEIRFTSLVRNPDLEPGLFQFTPPGGVDIIGALPGLQQAR